VSAFRRVHLGPISEIVMGQAPPGSDCNRAALGTPFVKAGEFGGRLPVIREWTTNPLRLAKRGDVLVCVVGATAGKVNEAIDCAIGRSVAAVRPDPSVLETGYLYHFFSTKVASLRSKSQGLAQGVITREMLQELTIPLPPLPEQRRIAGILDRADFLRAKRRTAVTQLETLGQSIFLNMFASASSEDWPLTTIDDVAAPKKGSIRTGPFGSQLLHSEFVESGIAVLGIDNAVENQFRWAKPRHISSKKYETLRRYTVYPGDVLITIMGTCGRCAVVPDDVPLAINTKHLCCITLDQTRCLPLFLHSYFLHHPLARKYLRQTAKGAVMDGLNMGLIRKLPLRLPPLPLQAKFDGLISATANIATAQHQAKSALDTLFASLQYRAFRGEL
jgi:type I restriction enzyme, S subunit